MHIRFASTLFTLLLVAMLAVSVVSGQNETFGGIVFEDANGNGAFDEGEAGVAAVLVSNGLDVVQTAEDGTYELPVLDEMVVFVTKPSGYMVPLTEDKVPQFYYIHQPNGSPDFIQEYEGIAPTGPLPESIDFALTPYEEPTAFDFIVYGDTQVTTHEEIGYLRDSAIVQLADSDALFGVAVGDLLNDPLGLFPHYIEVMGATPYPTWYLPGNHDLNFDSENDVYHLETYKSFFGPRYYSFEYGDLHFIMMDNIRWNVDEGFEGTYNGRIDDMQMQWIANNLQFVPTDKMIVVASHIGLTNYIDRDAEKHQETRREELYALLADYPNVISLAGHSHTLERMRPGEEYVGAEGSFGWGTIPFPQYVAGAVCGSWWDGPLDQFGIPVSYQRCGAPRGYMQFSVDGVSFSEQYVTTTGPDYMHISFDTAQTGFSAEDRAIFDTLGIMTVDELRGTTVVANVYAGGRDTVVTMSLNGGEAVPMEWTQDQRDPLAIRYQEGQDSFRFTEAGRSYHIYAAPLPSDLEPGTHTITVTATDPYGQVFTGSKVFDVWATN